MASRVRSTTETLEILFRGGQSDSEFGSESETELPEYAELALDDELLDNRSDSASDDDFLTPSVSENDDHANVTTEVRPGPSTGYRSQPRPNVRRARFRGRQARRGTRGRFPTRQHGGHESAATPVRDVHFGFEDDDPDAPVKEENSFHPSREPGIHLETMFTKTGLRKLSKPIELFKLFFTLELVTQITEYTNKYAWKHIFDKPYYAKQDGSWTETNPAELYKFIGILILFGLNKLPSMNLYWSKNILWGNRAVSQTMPRDRFTALLAFLHIVDPDYELPEDRLRKVRGVIDYISCKCQELFQPYNNISVDERMVKSKAKTSGMRQFMKDKPVRFGFKLWVLADSLTAYTWKFFVYTGFRESSSPHGLGYDVVIDLTENFQYQGYSLYIDNFYTSPTLLHDLYMYGIFATGTCKENRIGFPTSLKNSKEWNKVAERGDVRWVRNDHILYVQWKDNKVVNVASTEHSASGFALGKRRVKKNNQWQRIEVKKPKAIHAYNSYMSGVDRSDQLIHSYNVLRKCLRWWKTLFFHTIDIAVVNSYVLFTHLQLKYPDVKEFQRNKRYNQMEFREELVLELLEIEAGEKERPPSKPRPSWLSNNPSYESVHVPKWTDVRRNCKVCYTSKKMQVKSCITCTTCNVYLCVRKERNCFQKYHSRFFDDKR